MRKTHFMCAMTVSELVSICYSLLVWQMVEVVVVAVEGKVECSKASSCAREVLKTARTASKMDFSHRKYPEKGPYNLCNII
jgi:hypothetical protein